MRARKKVPKHLPPVEIHIINKGKLTLVCENGNFVGQDGADMIHARRDSGILTKN